MIVELQRGTERPIFQSKSLSISDAWTSSRHLCPPRGAGLPILHSQRRLLLPQGLSVGGHALSSDTQASHACSINLSGLGVLPTLSPIVQHYGPGQTRGGLHVLPLLREADFTNMA